MYAHSDEVEELAIINLSGVNIESQEHMEALIGVRFQLSNVLESFLTILPEAMYIHVVHILQLICTFSNKSERTTSLSTTKILSVSDVTSLDGISIV